MKRSIKIALLLLLTAGLFIGCGKGSTDYLILVNKAHPIEENVIDDSRFVETMNVYRETVRLEKQTFQAYSDLKKDLADHHQIEIGIDSTYRSIDEQKEVMKSFIDEYGEAYAKKTVAEPGTSEHHTGLAIDFVIRKNGAWLVENEDMMKEPAIFAEIHSVLAQCGFILRYPKGKETVTGYDYEPWHIRYVGHDAAKKITDSGLTLEEYLQDNK